MRQIHWVSLTTSLVTMSTRLQQAEMLESSDAKSTGYSEHIFSAGNELAKRELSGRTPVWLRAGDTHPTGMHSCYELNCSCKWDPVKNVSFQECIKEYVSVDEYFVKSTCSYRFACVFNLHIKISCCNNFLLF